jgi:hypothetical protein
VKRADRSGQREQEKKDPVLIEIGSSVIQKETARFRNVKKELYRM